MANEIYDSTWWGNTIDTASSIGTSTEMIQGQFNLTKIGDELVTNGDFANWTNDNPNDWNIIGTEDENNYITEYQGKARIVSNGGTIFISQDILSIGKFYKITADLVVNSGGGMRFQLGANGTHRVFTTSQKVVLYAQQDGTNGDLQIIRQGATDFTIDNVSVKQVRATTVEASKCLADTIHRIGLQDIQN